MGGHVGTKHCDGMGQLLTLLCIPWTQALKGQCGWTELDLEGLGAKTRELGVTSPSAFRMSRNVVTWPWSRPSGSEQPRALLHLVLYPDTLPCTRCPARAPWALPFPFGTPTTTHKAPEVLTAAERGDSSPEQWKSKLLKGLFPCSEYFYKANPQGLSPHTQLFLRFLTSSPGWACGDISGGRAVGAAPGVGEAGSAGSPEIWFGQRTFLGEGTGVK